MGITIMNHGLLVSVYDKDVAPFRLDCSSTYWYSNAQISVYASSHTIGGIPEAVC